MRALLASLRLAAALIGALPRRQVGVPLCWLAGLAWYLAAPATRAAVADNLRHVLGRPPTPGQVRAVFRSGALNYWDTFAIPRLTPEGLLKLVSVHGLDHLTAARAAGHGVILASAHLGSVGLVGQLLPVLGYPAVGVVEPVQPPELYELLTRQRQALGVRLLPAGPAALRELLAALRRNEVVGLITDRDVTGSGPRIDFFGAPTRFPDGPAALAVRTGAPILIAVAWRTRRGRFETVIEPPLPVPEGADPKDSVRRLTQLVAERLEYHVANHPEQWTVFQRRWPDVDVTASGDSSGQ